MLFSGTLRINLDPFNDHTDDEVWLALQTAHLNTFVSELTEGLEYAVAEGGENLRLRYTEHVYNYLWPRNS